MKIKLLHFLLVGMFISIVITNGALAANLNSGLTSTPTDSTVASIQSTGTPIQIGSGWNPFTWGSGSGLNDITSPLPDNEGSFTFTSTGSVVVNITDAFLTGDWFDVYDNGVLIGSTPRVPKLDTSITTYDPNGAYNDPRWSHGSFKLGPGTHSISMITEQGYYPGEGYIEVSKLPLKWPVPNQYNKVSSVFYKEYGQDCTRYLGKKPHPHKGIDIPAPKGTAVYAADDGTAVQQSNPGGYGTYIVITHSNGLSTLYAHLSKVVKTGKVQRGDKIGEVGNAGYSTGAHLHFEVGTSSTPIGSEVNPLDYFDRSKLILPHAVTYDFPSGKVEEAGGYILIREINDKKTTHKYTSLNDIYVYVGQTVNSGKVLADKF